MLTVILTNYLGHISFVEFVKRYGYFGMSSNDFVGAYYIVEELNEWKQRETHSITG